MYRRRFGLPLATALIAIAVVATPSLAWAGSTSGPAVHARRAGSLPSRCPSAATISAAAGTAYTFLHRYPGTWDRRRFPSVVCYYRDAANPARSHEIQAEYNDAPNTHGVPEPASFIGLFHGVLPGSTTRSHTGSRYAGAGVVAAWARGIGYAAFTKYAMGTNTVTRRHLEAVLAAIM